MKRKMILPLLAMAFALVSALAFTPPQTAWYDSNGVTAGGGMTGTITTPSGEDAPECTTSATQHLCKILANFQNNNAFVDQASAELNGGAPNSGVLRYDE